MRKQLIFFRNRASEGSEGEEENGILFAKYIFSLWKFILAAVLVFVFAAFNGYFFAQNSPLETKLVLENLQEVLGPIVEMTPFGQFLFVVLNNSLTVFLVIVLGIIFGLFPFLVLFSNGTILGIIAFFSKTELSWSTFFVGTLPHGIIEIPVVILACAIGLKLGKTLLDRVFKNRAPQKLGEADIKTELNTALVFFIKVLFPLLLLAAAVEIFITGQLL
jgi:stage II sporulation protein M